MALIKSDLIGLIELHVDFVGVFEVFYIWVAVVEQVHVVENLHYGGVSQVEQLDGGNDCVVAEFVGEGDLFAFDVEELLVLDGADGAVEGLPEEAEVGVDFRELVDVFEKFGAGFEVDDHGFGRGSAFFVGGWVVLDFFGSLHVEVVEIQNSLGQVNVRLHHLLYFDLIIRFGVSYFFGPWGFRASELLIFGKIYRYLFAV